jgi:hypothetical protein
MKATIPAFILRVMLIPSRTPLFALATVIVPAVPIRQEIQKTDRRLIL